MLIFLTSKTYWTVLQNIFFFFVHFFNDWKTFPASMYFVVVLYFNIFQWYGNKLTLYWWPKWNYTKVWNAFLYDFRLSTKNIFLLLLNTIFQQTFFFVFTLLSVLTRFNRRFIFYRLVHFVYVFILLKFKKQTKYLPFSSYLYWRIK